MYGGHKGADILRFGIFWDWGVSQNSICSLAQITLAEGESLYLAGVSSRFSLETPVDSSRNISENFSKPSRTSPTQQVYRSALKYSG
jgi:hypothetical protein